MILWNRLSALDLLSVAISFFIAAICVVVLRDGFDPRRLPHDLMIAATGCAATWNIVSLIEGWHDAHIPGAILNACLLGWIVGHNSRRGSNA